MKDCKICNNSRYLYNSVTNKIDKACTCIIKAKWGKHLSVFSPAMSLSDSVLSAELNKNRNISIQGSMSFIKGHIKWYLINKGLDLKYELIDPTRLVSIYCDSDTVYTNRRSIIEKIDILMILLGIDKAIKDLTEIVKYYYEVRNVYKKPTWVLFESESILQTKYGSDFLSWVKSPQNFTNYKVSVENTKLLRDT